MILKLYSVALAVALMLPIAILAQSQGEGRHKRHNAQKLAEKLNLSETQQSQVRDIMQKQATEMRALRENTSLSQEEKQARFRELRESTRTQMNAVLTPEQQEKFRELRKDHRGKGSRK